ncbi:Aste57867_8261 [Aphanomyces stellatus]|uniref:Aste57867_8261 protein n=1 Tax=Aphanomyces stellatus TaxID=120398 RepID=A0A485KJT7_9STRA|nr:hypothetical protein As57867_008230 [Aphanomyces stellatus]VFT85148.1 Aste57867_8261 [Aphanomyces stellatus]
MDEARVEFTFTHSDEDNHVQVFAVNDECYRCTFEARNRNDCNPGNDDCTDLEPNSTYAFTFDSLFAWDIQVRTKDDNATVLWTTRQTFLDRAEYAIQVNQSDAGTVQASFLQTRDGTTSSIMLIVLILILVWPLACLGLFCFRKQRRRRDENNLATYREANEDDELRRGILSTEAPTETPIDAKKKPTRVVCLDVFRGIIIFTMIFVNLGGGSFWYFNHAAWNGLTFADIVFPCFAWIMGVTMNIGVASHVKKQTKLWKMLVDGFLRAVKLFLLGLFVNDFRNFKGGRIPGVLQSFGFAYFYVTCAVVAGLAVESKSMPFLRRAVEGCIVLAVVVANLLVVFYLPVDGCPTGYLGPGGRGDDGLYPNCIGGAHLVVDRKIFGDAYMMQGGGTAAWIYGSGGPWDPEGFLNWLMVAFTAYLGYVVGGIFLKESRVVWKVCILGGTGAVLAVVGLALCGFKTNGGWIPINKNLWSLSFVLTVSGIACGMLALLYLIVDKWAIWGGTPFKQNGMNAIALYVGHEVLAQHVPFGWDRDGDSHTQAALSNLGGAVAWTLVALWMHGQGIFITV